MDMQVVSALTGTLVGVTATGALAWMSQKTQNRRELMRDEFRMRQALYGEFIAECARLMVDAFQHSLDKPETFVPLYALINRMRLCASKAVLTEAEQLVRRISEQYFSINLSVQELRELARSAESDALRTFGQACRAELKSLQARL
jgi:hypothetical protein